MDKIEFMLTLNPPQDHQEVLSQLLNLKLSDEIKNLLSLAFRIRVKIRESEDGNKTLTTLQIRLWPPQDFDQQMDLEESRIQLQELVKESGIQLIILEYKECCMEGCQNCQSFLKEMED